MPLTSSLPRLDAFAQTVVGRVRHHNEDSLLCCPALGLWAIADGMGGHQRGEVASALAAQTLQDCVRAGGNLVEAIHAANQAILAAAAETAGSQGMGSTVVAVHFTGHQYQLAWIGDSRAYLLRRGHIQPLTKDHSWVQTLIDAGELTETQARHHPKKNLINQCLGQDSVPLDVGLIEGRLAPGERLLLCSDGLNRELTDEQIQRIADHSTDLPALVHNLIEQANALGGHDNISCSVLALDLPTGLGARTRRWLSRLLGRRPGRDTRGLRHE
ncbi:MAG: protein phosphatase 2C domain-containing protein [Pseudomonas sp.]|uniref:PP2C family protein-serine/threonine phosphatase n=1 Tax=Pseudomonas sp. TaxID=306 RepID=UPI0033935899